MEILISGMCKSRQIAIFHARSSPSTYKGCRRYNRRQFYRGEIVLSTTSLLLDEGTLITVRSIDAISLHFICCYEDKPVALI